DRLRGVHDRLPGEVPVQRIDEGQGDLHRDDVAPVVVGRYGGGIQIGIRRAVAHGRIRLHTVINLQLRHAAHQVHRGDGVRRAVVQNADQVEGAGNGTGSDTEGVGEGRRVR